MVDFATPEPPMLAHDEASQVNLQVRRLAAVLAHPTQHIQRFVEEAAFLPDGGHSMARSIQIQLPTLRGESTPQPTRYAVPLGTFRRKRFPDIAVTACNGTFLSLLTRDEHGTFLTAAILAKYLGTVSNEMVKLQTLPETDPARVSLETLVSSTKRWLTQAGRSDEPSISATANLLRAFLSRLSSKQNSRQRKKLSRDFRRDLIELGDKTQYLCWVEGRPGDIVRLRVTYTMHDVRRELENYIIRPYALTRDWLKRRLSPAKPAAGPHNEAHRMKLYRLLGLAPMNYWLRIPSHQHASSYYFVLKPPPKTTVVKFVGVGEGAQANEAEMDCAAHCFHVHNENDPARSPFREETTASGARRQIGGGRSSHGGAIYAYLRPDLLEHKVIASGAFLNLLFVFFLARGRLLNGSGLPAQAWLLLTPTVLLGFIAQRQRHYYAFATRLQRGTLWAYLGMSALFLVVAGFSRAHERGSWGPKATVAFFGFAIASALITMLYMPMGYFFRRCTERLARPHGGAQHISKETELLTYDRAVRRYCDGVIAVTALAVVLVAAGATVMVSTGWIKAGKAAENEGFAPRVTINVNLPRNAGKDSPISKK